MAFPTMPGQLQSARLYQGTSPSVPSLGRKELPVDSSSTLVSLEIRLSRTALEIALLILGIQEWVHRRCPG